MTDYDALGRGYAGTRHGAQRGAARADELDVGLRLIVSESSS